MKKIILIFFGIALIGIFSPNLWAQIQDIRIGVDGMTWGLWAHGVKKTLKRLDGVKDVQISLKTQSAEIELYDNAKFNPKSLEASLKEADFHTGEIWIKVAGELNQHKAGRDSLHTELALKIPSTGQILILEKFAELRNEQEGAKNALDSLQKAFQSGKKNFTIHGQLLRVENELIYLGIKEFVENEIKD